MLEKKLEITQKKDGLGTMNVIDLWSNTYHRNVLRRSGLIKHRDKCVKEA